MVQVHGQCSFGEIVDVYVLGFSDYPCPKFVHLAVVVLFFQESTPGEVTSKWHRWRRRYGMGAWA